MKPSETLVVRIETTDIDKMEKDLLIFNIKPQLTLDYQAYFAMLTPLQIRHFAEEDYPYLTLIRDCPYICGGYD